MAPLSSSGSSRRMPGNTPAVRATASVSRPQHQPTWLFSVSVTVATKWRGRGGKQALSANSGSIRMEAAVVFSNIAPFPDWNEGKPCRRVWSFTSLLLLLSHKAGHNFIPWLHHSWWNPVLLLKMLTFLCIGCRWGARTAVPDQRKYFSRPLCCLELICFRDAVGNWLLYYRKRERESWGIHGIAGITGHHAAECNEAGVFEAACKMNADFMSVGKP